MKIVKKLSVKEFIEICKEILEKENFIITVIGGYMGRGKSCLSAKLLQEYTKQTGNPWDFNKMTWEREELKTWIDGIGEDKKEQLPKGSGIIVEELATMLLGKNWFDTEQKKLIGTFKTCRDRNLFIVGNTPDFWELDNSFKQVTTIYIYLEKRGVAMVFSQLSHSHKKDLWDFKKIEKAIDKYGYPKDVDNFIGRLTWEDWKPKEKEQYEKIRNEKRIVAIERNATKQKKQGNKDLRQHKKLLIDYIFNPMIEQPTNERVARLLNVSKETIRRIRQQ